MYRGGLPERFLQTLFNLFFDGFGFSGTLAISPGDVAFFFVVIIGYPRDLLSLIPGFPGKRGFRRFIISLGIMVFPGVILR